MGFHNRIATVRDPRLPRLLRRKLPSEQGVHAVAKEPHPVQKSGSECPGLSKRLKYLLIRNLAENRELS
jgi:hypothetical protein